MSSIDPISIGAYEAKRKFSQLLERVAAGTEITIMRHGQPAARLAPVLAFNSIARRKEAIEKMRELAASNRLDGPRISELIAEGQK